MVRSRDKDNTYKHASKHFYSGKNWREPKYNYKRMTYHSHLHERIEENLGTLLKSKGQDVDGNPCPPARHHLLLMRTGEIPVTQGHPLVS